MNLKKIRQDFYKIKIVFLKLRNSMNVFYGCQHFYIKLKHNF